MAHGNTAVGLLLRLWATFLAAVIVCPFREQKAAGAVIHAPAAFLYSAVVSAL